MRTLLLAALLSIAIGTHALSQAQPSLQLQGKPYFGGSMTLHLSAPAGQPALLAYGLQPLREPVQTGKGAWYVGSLVNLVGLGTIPATGRIDLPFVMPPEMPALAALPIVLQAYVPVQLSNPAALILDEPYLLPKQVIEIDHPLPTVQALFGDSLAAGDFNDDEFFDLAAGAWFEDVGGVDKAGRVYVMWGPDFSGFTRLEPAAPVAWLHFGLGLVAADFDGDGITDLGIGQGTGGDPPLVGPKAKVFVHKGGPSFPAAPLLTASSLGTGQDDYLFGRIMRAGDLNGDGWIDLVVCAPDATVGGSSRAGRLEVFHGPDLATPLAIDNPDPKVNDFFGSRLALADISGDGIVDIVEASGRAKVGSVSQAGRVHVYDGPTLVLLKTIDNPVPTANARFGEGLFAADLTNDGAAEIIVADVKKHTYVVWEPLTSPAVSTWQKPPTPNPTTAASSYGYFFAASDVNEDGGVDIAISDPFEGDAQGCGVLGGGGTIYFALAPYFSTYLRLPNPTAACGETFSWNLIAADLNADGRVDFIAGNDGADIGGIENAGRIHVIFR